MRNLFWCNLFSIFSNFLSNLFLLTRIVLIMFGYVVYRDSKNVIYKENRAFWNIDVHSFFLISNLQLWHLLPSNVRRSASLLFIVLRCVHPLGHNLKFVLHWLGSLARNIQDNFDDYTFSLGNFVITLIL